SGELRVIETFAAKNLADRQGALIDLRKNHCFVLCS
ncbi:MAG: hypothetical protein QOH96_1163, partial [Blastocatellia bacterium]|nr:hypothetical protein [Blastocatellia bacterium]